MSGQSRWLLYACVSAFLVSTPLLAQPQAYSLVETNSLFGPVVAMTINRDGAKAMVDSNSGTTHTRTLYDLATGKTIGWDVKNNSGCSSGTFSGDWGDPFSPDMMNDIAKQNPKDVGTATINGIATKIMEASNPQMGKMRIWIDEKDKLLVKLAMVPNGGAPDTKIEVKALVLAKPAASVFAIPAACAAAAAAPAPPTDAQRIAKATGGNAANYMDALMPPPSNNSCMVLFKVVHAGTLDPLTDGFQAALDLTYDVDHPPHYTTGLGANNHATFSGGGIREVQFHNGGVAIAKAPADFYLTAHFADGHDDSALIYRQCPKPTSTLLLVVGADSSAPDQWLWVK